MIMKKLLSICLIFLSVQAFGQSPTNYSYYKQRTRQYSMMLDSMLYVPRYCGAPSIRVSETSTIDGAIAIDTCNHVFYIYSGGSWIATGAGSTNSNIGSGFRLAVPGTNNIKTLFPGLYLNADSSTNANAITIGIDTAGLFNTAARVSDVWLKNGNTGTNPSSNWIGTNTDEVSASLLFKVGGQYAGYIRRTFSNDSVSPVAPSHGFTTYGQYAGKSILDRVIATPSDSSLLLLNQTLIGYQTGRRIGVILPSDRAGATPSDENLFVGNSVGRMTRVSSGIYGKGRNTIVSSGFGFYRNLSGSYNAGLGQFVLELNNAGNGNSAFGDGALRSSIDGDFNASFGGSGMLYNSTGVYSVTVVSGGSGYTVGDTVIFSSPLSNGPGTYYATATGRVSAVDGGGAITSVQVLTPGGGYVSRGDSCFYVGTCHPAVTATAGGSGTGASLVPVLRSGSYNTGSGISNGANNILSQYMTYFGYNAGNVGSYRYWDNYGIAIGPYSGVSTGIDAATAVDNWIAFGRNARVSESNTAALGDSATYNYKWVINGTVGDSALKVNNGFHVTRGVRFSGLPQPGIGSYSFVPKYTSDGTITNSIITETPITGGAGIGVDDVANGTTTTNPYLLVLRNAYAGDASSNAEPMLYINSTSTSSNQKYPIRSTATSMPDGSRISIGLGKVASTRDIFFWTYHHTTNGSTGNYLEEQFQGVNNVARTYASGNKTIGSSITTDNGYRLEVGGKTRITDTLWGQGGVRFSGLASSANAADSMMVVDASTGNVGYRAIPSGGSYTASNGITLSGSNFKLGGALGENTQIALDGFDLIVPDFDNFADTTNWKPVVINTTGSGASVGTLRKATYWPGGGGGSGITVGTTTITSGTSGRIAYNNAGVYGEKAVTGSGDVVLATSPTITTGYYVNDGANKLQVATNFYGADFISKSVRFQSSGNTYFKVTTNDESGTDPATTVTTVVTGKPGLRIVLTGSQTADAFQVHNSGGNTLADITKDGVLDLYNYGTAPSASVTNGIRLYAEDVSSSAELKVRDEAGNITTISPHNFGKIPGGRSEKMAWSFYSERNGEYITADMTKALRTIEKQSAEIEELKAQIAKLRGLIYIKKKPVKIVYTGKK